MNAELETIVKRKQPSNENNHQTKTTIKQNQTPNKNFILLKMKSTLISLSLGAIALLSSAEGFGRKMSCVNVLCATPGSYKTPQCRPGQKQVYGCCGVNCRNGMEKFGWDEEEEQPARRLRKNPEYSTTIDEMEDEAVGQREYSTTIDEMEDEAVGDNFEQPSHTRNHAPDSGSVRNYFGWDEEEEQPARRLRKKRYAMLCRFHGKAGHYTVWNKPGNLPCGGKYCCNKNDNL